VVVIVVIVAVTGRAVVMRHRSPPARPADRAVRTAPIGRRSSV